MDQVISQPKVTLNIIPGLLEISNAPQKVLVISQKTSVGTAISGALVENILNDNSWNTFFGENAMISGMINGYKGINQVTQIDAISLDDNGGGVAATGTVGFLNTATANGTFEVTVGSDKNNKYSINVVIDDTADDIGAAVETAINADTKAPVTASNTSGTVTLTAVNAGTVGNSITLKVDGVVAGITPSVVAMASGATDPVLTGVFDVVGDNRYQTIVAPVEYGADFLTDFLDPRFNATNAVLDGVGIITQTDTFANLITNGDLENSQSLVYFGNKIVTDTLFKGSSIIELNAVQSAEFSALRALRLTDGANIANIVITTSGPLDSFGGKEIASLPYFNTPFFNISPIETGKGFDANEMDFLKNAGISVLGNNIPRNTIISGEVVTTRKTDTAGNPELTFKFLNSVDTSSVIREFFFNNYKAAYAQSRLTNGDLVPGRSMANPTSIREFTVSKYQSLQGLLAEGGEDALNFFKDNLQVSVDTSTGKATVTMKVQIVGQLREISGTIQITFSGNN